MYTSKKDTNISKISYQDINIKPQNTACSLPIPNNPTSTASQFTRTHTLGFQSDQETSEIGTYCKSRAVVDRISQTTRMMRSCCDDFFCVFLIFFTTIFCDVFGRFHFYNNPPAQLRGLPGCHIQAEIWVAFFVWVAKNSCQTPENKTNGWHLKMGSPRKRR